MRHVFNDPMQTDELLESRNKLRLSQPQLARLVGGFHADTAWKWENGACRIPNHIALLVRLMCHDERIFNLVKEATRK